MILLLNQQRLLRESSLRMAMEVARTYAVPLACVRPAWSLQEGRGAVPAFSVARGDGTVVASSAEVNLRMRPMYEAFAHEFSRRWAQQQVRRPR